MENPENLENLENPEILENLENPEAPSSQRSSAAPKQLQPLLYLLAEELDAAEGLACALHLHHVGAGSA